MELNEAMQSRRSIRNFKPNVVLKRETIEALLTAAQMAPSWKNSQTGRYYVALTPEYRKMILRTCLPEMNQKRAANASALIITAFEKGVSGFSLNQEPLDEVGDGWGAYDLGLQNQNLLLRAREMGLDTLVMGIRNTDVLRQLFSVPTSQEILAVIAVGVRQEEPEMPHRRDLSEIAFFF